MTPRTPHAAVPPTTTPSSAGSSVRPTSGSESRTEVSLHTRSRSLCGLASPRLYETPCSLRYGPRATTSQRHTAASKSPPAHWVCAPTSCSCSSSLSAHLTLLLPLSFAVIGSKWGRCACDRVRVLCQAHTHTLPGAASTYACSPNPQFLLHARHRNPQIERMADAPEKWEEVKGARRHGAVKRKKVHTANNHRFIAR